MSRDEDAVAEVLVDDDLVRVTRFTFAQGAQTGWHTHAMDYVIMAVTECRMRLEAPDGEVRDVLVPAGGAYRRDVGVQHNVINAGDAPMIFVEVEIKASA